MRLVKREMLLFCKERSSYAHALYFVEFGTLDDLSPRIHRYFVGPLAFEKFDLGGVYRLEVLETRVHASVLSGTYALSDDDYLMLMELRDLRFGDVTKESTFIPADYYTFEETKAILAYREPYGRHIPLFLLRIAAYAAAFLIPFVLYLLLLFVSFGPGGVRGAAVTGPLLAIGALPLVVYLMSLLFSLATYRFLQWEKTRYSLLKQYVLRDAGKRKPIVMSQGERKRHRRTGVAAAIIAAFFLLIHLIF